ncbi:MAG: GNAT family N-acetyltransferase [Kangiella sp.]|jgi:RimJ/RimL family protein N-acetyltransferase|nr:GNAT family N-acetyltransferase [Kangiella sp.]MCW9028467.1 GNAT family N-acetyltransferase [Kangiella sp.]
MFESLCSFERDGFKYRLLNKSDKLFFIDLYTNNEVMKYICAPFTEEEAELLFEDKITKQTSNDRNRFVWVVVNDDVQLGLVGLTKIDGVWDIGSVLSSTSLGRGYGARVMSALLSKVFEEYPIERISGTIPTNNMPCIKCVKKLGFKYSGEKRGGDQIWHLESSHHKTRKNELKPVNT